VCDDILVLPRREDRECGTGRDDREEDDAVKMEKVATFKQFKHFTLAVARNERKVDPKAPKIWRESIRRMRRGRRHGNSR
jgi:hypothetical protein